MKPIRVPWPIRLPGGFVWPRVYLSDLPRMLWRKLTTGEWFSTFVWEERDGSGRATWSGGGR